MMGTRAASRLWLLGGILVIAVLIAATYLLAIKPVYDDQTLKETQVDDTNVELVKLRRELAGLKAKSNHLAAYTAELAAKKQQLPDSYDIPNYLRQLQDSDGAVKVDTSSVGVSSPIKVAGSAAVVGVPVTLTAAGKPADLVNWLDRLLHKQSRAALIRSASLQQNDGTNWTSNVTVTLFCSKTDDTDCTVAGN
jgi:Tfp pilus assembly protein PilO